MFELGKKLEKGTYKYLQIENLLKLFKTAQNILNAEFVSNLCPFFKIKSKQIY